MTGWWCAVYSHLGIFFFCIFIYKMCPSVLSGRLTLHPLHKKMEALTTVHSKLAQLQFRAHTCFFLRALGRPGFFGSTILGSRVMSPSLRKIGRSKG